MRKLVVGILVICVLFADVWADPKVYLKDGTVTEGKKVYLSDDKVTLIQRRGLFFQSSKDFPKEEVLAVVDGTSVLFSQKGVGFTEVTEYPGLWVVPLDVAAFWLTNWQLKKGIISREEANICFIGLGIETLINFIPKKEMKPVLTDIASGEKKRRQTLSEVCGYVVKIEGNQVRIDLGSQDGMKVGTILKVCREKGLAPASPDELLKTIKIDVGKIEVIEVQLRASIAKIISLEPNQQINALDIVKVVKHPRSASQAVHLSFPFKATIYRKNGRSLICTIKRIKSGFIEYQAALFGTDRIALKDVDFIKTADGIKLKGNDLWNIVSEKAKPEKK